MRYFILSLILSTHCIAADTVPGYAEAYKAEQAAIEAIKAEFDQAKVAYVKRVIPLIKAVPVPVVPAAGSGDTQAYIDEMNRKATNARGFNSLVEILGRPNVSDIDKFMHITTHLNDAQMPKLPKFTVPTRAPVKPATPQATP
jgi:hypothetical protein